MTSARYESRYIRANHPDRAQAIWLRWTLLVPNPGEPVADVWVMLFDPEGNGNRAVKVPRPISAADYRSEPWSAQIADTAIDDTRARGVLADHTLGSDDHPWTATGRQATYR